MTSSCLALAVAWLMAFTRISGLGEVFSSKDSEIISGWASRTMVMPFWEWVTIVPLRSC